MMSNVWDLDLIEAAQALRAGDITAESLASELIARTEANLDLNAFVTFEPEIILNAARSADIARKQGKVLGRLHGVPICVKDNIDAVGYATTACTPGLATNNPKNDAPVVAALAREGAIIFGKNTMHELAFGITSNNTAYGPVRNPYDQRMIPGGSSGGTAAAVAARLVPAGIGTDTGGSNRVPAALCGVSGLRPTVRRWGQEGIVPIARTRDTAGPIARSVDGLRLIDGIVTGDIDDAFEVGLTDVRLGVPRRHYWDDLESDVEAACSECLRNLTARGVTLVDVDLPEMESINQAISLVVALYEPKVDIPAYLSGHKSDITLSHIIREISNPDVRHVMQGVLDAQSQVPTKAYLEAIGTHRPRLTKLFADCFVRYGIQAMVFPTTPLSARPIGDDDTVELNGRRLPTFATFIRNTDPGSNAGLPGVTIPVGLSRAGLPIGLAMDGPVGSDRRLLAIAAQMAESLPRIAAPKAKPTNS
jgi:indoleacetamide hydrolase